jgi:2-polyprenyl-6-methoxyphenol hydroxylase-like FAD-dependent oxidoreductase
MGRILIAGGSLGGLAVALFAARADREVVLVEADPHPVPDTVEDAWAGWRRRGVPQFHQLHGTQALGRAVLASAAPDVLRRLSAAGGHEADLLSSSAEARHRAGADGLVQLRCRRPILEWVLRTAVAAEPTVSLRPGTEVTGLVVSRRGAPRVTGVQTTGGEEPADLVVDATGRRSRAAEWCARAGLRPPETTAVDTGQAYYTRWFRRDRAFTGAEPMLRVDLPFAALLVVPADAGWFSATFFAPAHDHPLRTALMDPDRFVRAIRRVPPGAAWMDDATPVSDVLFMGKLANQRRRWAPGADPPIGLLPVADAAVCTNPTWGRGAALALGHAAHLAHLIEQCDDPVAVTAGHARWTAEHLEPWFADTLLLDAETNAAWAGRRPPPPSSDRPFGHADAVRLARTDPAVLVAYLRYRGLLDAPGAFWADPGTVDRVLSAEPADERGTVPRLPDRAEFLDDLDAARRV